ncbi:MAG: transaldolase family protein [Acetivibrionales bacterium]|jgi:transaldolase
MGGYFKRVAEMTPTRLWINNVTVEQARKGIAAGAVGCTQNPSYVSKMLKADPALCNSLFDKWIEKTDDDTEALIQVQAEMVGMIAKEFLPLYESTQGKLGYVTIQGDPFRENTETIMRQADIARAYGPNIMIKIPVVPDGIKAISSLAGMGIPVCCTEVFALRQAIDICEAFLKATEGKPKPVAYLAHIAGIYDEYLANYVQANNVDIKRDVLWHAGISIAKKVYEVVKERRYPVEFLSGGARGLHHFTEMVGAEASVTINWAGTGEELEAADPLVVQRFHMPTPFSVVDELLRKLPDYKKGYFADAIMPEEYESFGPVALFRSTFEKGWKQALKAISERRAARK